MAGRDTREAQARSGAGARSGEPAQAGAGMPGPDMMLGLWASWMDRMGAPGQGAAAGTGAPWWQATTRAPTPDVLAGGVRQLEEGLGVGGQG